MPYFSFIFDKKIPLLQLDDLSIFKTNIKYYSKNTKLWSKLNKANKKNVLIHLKKEELLPSNKNYKSILFCLPPNIGLGDAIEYGLAIKAIFLFFPNIKIGIAHTGRFLDVFKNEFNLPVVYDALSELEMNKFDTLFHFTKEIPGLTYQKYNRQDIEKLITEFFKVPFFRKKISTINFSCKKGVISIFPISDSPIRSLPLYILNTIVEEFINDFKIEIYLSSNSEISEFIYSKLCHYKNIIFKSPTNVEDLICQIKKIKYGIFVDSGPLHVAKIYNKKGLLVVSSVDKKILLNNFNSITTIQSNYKSSYCDGPCGLINAFEYNEKYGCYDMLSVDKSIIMNKSNLNALQRGDLKNNYLEIYKESPNCYKKIKLKKIVMFLKKDLNYFIIK